MKLPKMKKRLNKLVAIAGTLVLAACSREAGAAQKLFVLWDPGLQLPAVCYPLDADWQGMGKIVWNMRGDNKFLTTTILASPVQHMIVQTAGPMLMVSEVLTPQRLAEFQNPQVLARNLAVEINKGIVVPELSGFEATGGRFTQDVPQFTRMMAASYNTGSGMAHISAFGFEGTFTCLYGGVRCEAKYVTSYAVSISAVPNPRIPKICSWTRAGVVLAIAPPGRMSEALRVGGRMFASAFVNYAWIQQRDRTFNALVQGTIQGRNAGFDLWRKSQAETAATLDRVRKMRSQQIREVTEVDNPFEPGTKVERPAFFKNSWINSRQDLMLLSDTSLEPNTIRGLMEQGEWLPAN